MEIKISVVIPTYRRPALLKRCIEALINQNFDKSDYEVIVISDGPDENTRDVLKSYQVSEIQLKYLFPNEKKGPASARNLGWLNAKGTLTAFTDDDCIPDINWLHDIWKEYKNEEKIVFTGTVKVPISQNPTDYELNICHLETAEFVTANCICTKKALLAAGGFDERFTAAWREDSDLHFKFLEQGVPIRKIDALVVHPVRQAPWGISIKEQKKGMFNALLYKKYPHLYRQRIKPAPSWNYYFMILGFIAAIVGLLLKSGILTIAGTALWLFLLLRFIQKRLSAASLDARHVSEMVFTSILIPFLSVYWQLYGAWKYKVLFL